MVTSTPASLAPSIGTGVSETAFTIYRRSGKRQDGREHPSMAARMYRQMNLRLWLEQAEAELRTMAE